MTEATIQTRIASFDVIRGVAVMGIFSVNVMSFGMIASAYLNPTAFGGQTGANFLVWAANLLLIDGKMRSLFSILFGASMMLVIERAEAQGRSALRTHMSRMAVLFGFGVVHYYFIWFGDILANYAVAGTLVFLLRRRSPPTLILLGIAGLLIQSLYFGWELLAQFKVQAAAHAPGASKEAIDAWNAMAGYYHPDAARIAKDQSRHLGPWSVLFERRLDRSDVFFEYVGLDLPATAGLMLIGMAGFKSGFLTGFWSDSRYRRFARWTVPLGIAGFAAVLAVIVRSQFDGLVIEACLFIAGNAFATILALGYAALIILFAQVWLVAPLFWAIMLLWSKPWLDRFHYGPLEWVWRSLARGKLQPFRKRLPVGEPAAA